MRVLPAGGERPWRFALASVRGSSHVRTGTPCQDASLGEVLSSGGASTFLGVVSDGAGSAPLSRIGARTCCEIWRQEARAVLERGGAVADLDRGFALHALGRFQAALTRVARRAGRPLRDFACTLLFAAVDERSSTFAQIGDGAIVVANPDPEGEPPFRWVFWPRQGEYVNQTFFATDPGAAAELDFEQRHGPLDELALFSDGIQGLVLDLLERRAHPGFFAPVLGPVRRAAPGRSDSLSRALERFLLSPAVQARSDDDKSLVLASRREPAPRAALPRTTTTEELHA